MNIERGLFIAPISGTSPKATSDADRRDAERVDDLMRLARNWCLAWGEWAHDADPGAKKEAEAEYALRKALVTAFGSMHSISDDRLEQILRNYWPHWDLPGYYNAGSKSQKRKKMRAALTDNNGEGGVGASRR